MNGVSIAVDVDGTLSEHDEQLCQLLSEDYDVDIYSEDLREWGQPLSKIDHDWGSAIEKYWEHPQFIPEMDPIPGAIEAVQTWHDKGARIIIATHRPDVACPRTKEWLETHEVPYDEFICGASWDKSEANGDILIDDAPHNMHAVADAGQHGILSLRYFNFDKIPDRERVHAASDVLDHSPLSLVSNPKKQWIGIEKIVENIISSNDI